MERDYVADSAASTDNSSSASPGSKANPDSNAPKSFAKCEDGMAAGMFECDGIDMLGHVTMEELGSVFVNDMWGWTDPVTGQDFALVGGSEGVFFIDITDPKRPAMQGILPTHTTAGGDFWRDIKVFDDHAFVVSENSGHGVQVMDLSVLRDWDGERTTYLADARYDGVGSVHNIAINEATGYAYAVGSSAGQTRDDIDCGSGLHMIDVNDPLNPTYAGCFQEHGYVHDTQCVVYDGPDADHQGHEICFNSTPSGPESVSIVDVTDKANPVAIGDNPYPDGAYSHQGWLSPDLSTFFHGDEIDEAAGAVDATTTRVWNMDDLDNPLLVETFANDTTSIDHNMYTEGDRMYQSNYTTGLRIMDIDDAANSGLEEIAYFDVYPQNDNASFEGGTWSNYPYFSQPHVVGVSSIDRGFFVLRVDPQAGKGNGRR
ncbi:choice-of-anchor B family protein [Nitriliruptoria bacterium AS10]|nr:choice-of-anchor B family protein [Salsipaludibacter albus]